MIMKKVFKVIKRIVVSIFLICYFSLILLLSTLLLNRNDYGVTEIKDKTFINITSKNANGKYKVGDLVILDKKKIADLKVGDEIFVYQPNKKTKTVDIIISEISLINTELKSPFVTIKYNETSWAEDYIAGKTSSIYHTVGGVLEFFEGKWIFLLTLIIPCFFILLYEIYLLIVTIKYDDYEDVETEKKTVPATPSPITTPVQPVVESPTIQNNVTNGIIYITEESNDNETNDKLLSLSKELEELKQKIDSGNTSDSDTQKINDLMKELENLKQNIK